MEMSQNRVQAVQRDIGKLQQYVIHFAIGNVKQKYEFFCFPTTPEIRFSKGR